jgi:hypothetical protein
VRTRTRLKGSHTSSGQTIVPSCASKLCQLVFANCCPILLLDAWLTENKANRIKCFALRCAAFRCALLRDARTDKSPLSAIPPLGHIAKTERSTVLSVSFCPGALCPAKMESDGSQIVQSGEPSPESRA